MKMFNKVKKIFSVLVLLFILLTLVLILMGCSNNVCNDYESQCIKTKSTVQPVEIIYKRTTYKTRYIPQTTKEVTYEKRPYNCK